MVCLTHLKIVFGAFLLLGNVARGQQKRFLSKKQKSLPVQPQRLWNPMCIGIIGGVGPEASADVLKKAVDYAGKQTWHFQARDTPSIYLSSSPRLDGITQNSWNHYTEDEQKAIIGKVLEDIKNEFPDCVRKSGAFGLACNTIHQYLYKWTNDDHDFVSLMNAVNQTFIDSGVGRGGDVYILGSAVTMSRAGEYSDLFDYFDVNANIPEEDRGLLWKNVILKVQQNDPVKLKEASEYLYGFLDKFNITAPLPVSLSCTELPVAAQANMERYNSGKYSFVDPNEALAELLVKRAEERTQELAPEQYKGWKSGIGRFKDTCCVEDGETWNCEGKCCQGYDCS